MGSTHRKQGRGALKVRRLPVVFSSDYRRVITRFFTPGKEARIRNIVERVRGLSDEQVDRLLDKVLLSFGARHDDLAAVLDENYCAAVALAGTSDNFSPNRRRLIGAYLTAEYSIESAALFNPSIVPHHNQQNVASGAVRFIMSLRATGEGHVSSIVFRTGVITADNHVQIAPCGRLTQPVRTVPDKQYDKPLFRRKLRDIGVYEAVVDLVLDRLGDSFTAAQLEGAIGEVPHRGRRESATRRGHRGRPLAGPLELPVAASAGGRSLRGGHFSADQQREPRHRGPAHGPLRGRRRHGYLLRHLHGLRRLPHTAPALRDPRLPGHRRAHDQRRLRGTRAWPCSRGGSGGTT